MGDSAPSPWGGPAKAPRCPKLTPSLFSTISFCSSPPCRPSCVFLSVSTIPCQLWPWANHSLRGRGAHRVPRSESNQLHVQGLHGVVVHAPQALPCWRPGSPQTVAWNQALVYVPFPHRWPSRLFPDFFLRGPACCVFALPMSGWEWGFLPWGSSWDPAARAVTDGGRKRGEQRPRCRKRRHE